MSLFLFAYMGEKEGQASFQGLSKPDSTVVLFPSMPGNYYQQNQIVGASLLLFEDEIAPNQSLSEILLNFNVTYAIIDKIAKRSKKVFDVRKLNPGKKYLVFYSDDSIQQASYFIYELDAANYIVYGLTDSLHI